MQQGNADRYEKRKTDAVSGVPTGGSTTRSLGWPGSIVPSQRSIVPSKYVLRGARWFRTLGDPNRLEILRWIARHPPATVTDVVREFGLSQPLVSHHLKQLRDEGLVRKDEDRIRAGHRVDPETLAALARELSRLAAIAREEERMAADERRRQRRRK
jgi:DNA-binding transcriptional ArsR family regulator